MYKFSKPTTTTLNVNTSYIAERIEQKVNRIVNNKEPITDGAPLIYTDRSEGVMAATDIRTDRFEIAVDAMDKVQKSKVAKREERQKSLGEQAKDGIKIEQKSEGGAQSSHGTTGNDSSK